MPAFRTALFMVTVLAVALAAFAGGHSAGRLAREAGGGPPSLRADVLRLLGTHYYRRVDQHLLDGRSLHDLPRVLDDPYTQVLGSLAVAKRDQNEAGRYAGIGVHLVQRRGGVGIDQVRPHGPAARAGIRPGDLLTGVDGHRIGATALDDAGQRLRGRAGSRVTVQLSGRSLTLTRSELHLTLVRSRLLGTTGVISLSEFASGAGVKVRAAARGLLARGARRLVLDLRGNPGGYVREAVSVAGTFLEPGAVVVRERGRHIKPFVLRTRTAPLARRVPLVVLVDQQSASAAEIVAGALRDHRRALLVGQRTYGKGVIQDVLPLPGGAELKLTIAEDRTPAGTVIQHRGLAPDVLAHDNPGTVRDDALSRAVAVLVEAAGAGGRPADGPE